MTTETTAEVIEMTPHAAIQHAIWELIERRAEWQKRDDPNGVLEWIESRIECLSEAQRQLEEFREVKRALSILKGVALV